jgi:hypothetical protein
VIALRDFTQTDWYGFSGATSPEGGQPQIGECVVIDNDARENGEPVTREFGAVVLVDANSICILYEDHLEYSVQWTYSPVDEAAGVEARLPMSTFEMAKLVAIVLPERATVQLLRALGFGQYTF